MNNAPQKVIMLFAALSILLGVIGGCMNMGDEIKKGNDMIKCALYI